MTPDTLHPSIGLHRFAVFSPTCTRYRTLWVEKGDKVAALVALWCVFVPLDLMHSLLLPKAEFSIEQTAQFAVSVVGTIHDLAPTASQSSVCREVTERAISVIA